MKRSLEIAAEALHGAEFILCACVALVLVAVGPVIWCHRLISADRIAWAIVVAVLWLGSIVVVAFEVHRKAITAVSSGFFLAWVLVMLWVFRGWFA